jgi:hypothetical protein
VAGSSIGHLLATVALAVLAIHVPVIAFNVFGLIAILFWQLARLAFRARVLVAGPCT